ncbi:MAG: hypothetical protein WC796_00500 [Candidatus Pacearchaeota archaeon]|jgi:hypothetical protein
MPTFLVNHKSGQLKMQQMIFMIIAVFIFFTLVFLIYASMNLSSLKREARDSQTEKVAGMVVKLASTPEFNFNNQPSSVDIDKLMVLKDKKVYAQFLGIDGAIIEKIYPTSKGIECTETNYPECDIIRMFTKEDIAKNFASSAFVAWCRKVTVEGRSYNKCELARMVIEARNITGA